MEIQTNTDKQLPVETPPEHRPLIRGLVEAAENEWGGLLRVHDTERQVGAIVMRKGCIAWAVFEQQKEDLGAFLYRIGKLSREQLEIVKKRYVALGRTKKFGAILEESGLISRPVLRQCLLLHIRSALLSMITRRELTVVAAGGELSVEEDLTFSLSEILSPQETEADLDARNHVFAELARVPGYCSTLIAGPGAEVLMIHGVEDNDHETLNSATLPLRWLQSAQHVAQESHLGTAEFAFLEFENSTLVVRWIGAAREFLVALYLERTGKIGMAKHRLNLVAPALEAYVQDLSSNQQVEDNP